MKNIHRKLLPAFLLLTAFQGFAQTGSPARIASFSFWKPKPGQEQLFEMGYKKHLQWHAGNGELWNWYGWYIVSGQHADQFLDATFDHAWSDFDHPVSPAGDGADNSLHTEPFGDFLYNCKVSRIDEASICEATGLQTRFTRMFTFTVTDITGAARLLTNLKDKYVQEKGIKNFQCFRLVDGGSLDQMILLVGIPDWQHMEQTQDITADLAELERSAHTHVILQTEAALLSYQQGMSLLH